MRAAGRYVVLYLHSTSNHNYRREGTERPRGCIISSFYIKPQPGRHGQGVWTELYYIFILHQTTTKYFALIINNLLYYIFILHQTTTWVVDIVLPHSCIISSFYIKPQHANGRKRKQLVVLYLHSTSNHNTLFALAWPLYVVLYLHSTSNHNTFFALVYLWRVVLYLHSTSNHN